MKNKKWNKNKVVVILFFSILFASNPAFSTNSPHPGAACYYPPFGQIYQTFISGKSFAYDNGHGPYSYLACSDITPLGALGSCNVVIPSGQPQAGTSWPGQKFTINQVIQCDIDSYVWALLISCGGAAGLAIKKKKAN